VKRGDRVTVRLDDEQDYAGTVLVTALDLGSLREKVKVRLDEDPPIISGWRRDSPWTWWFVSEQVTSIN